MAGLLKNWFGFGLLKNRFRVGRRLGAGSFGETFLAEDTQKMNAPCVIKRLITPNDPDHISIIRKMFKQEAEKLDALNHQGIPKLIAYFEDRDNFYLVQEFIDGNTLDKEINFSRKWTEKDVTVFLLEVLEILAYVHSQGSIHRDLKPNNMMRRKVNQKLVLIDFGAVRNVRQTTTNMAIGLASGTITIGTPGYMPTEQAAGNPCYASDVYAIGCIAIQALSGVSPFPDGFETDPNTGEIKWRHLVQVSDGLANLIDQMVRYDYRHRYFNGRDALAAVQAWANSAGITPPPTPLPPPPTTTSPTLPTTTAPTKTANSAKFLFGSIGIISGGLAVWGFFFLNDSDFEKRKSEGEKLLIKAESNRTDKDAAIAAFKRKDYLTAIAKLESYRNPSDIAALTDPEALIYLNNAKVGDLPSLKIAVSVPIGGNNLDAAKEILRGVAQAQNEVNSEGGINRVLLKIVIIDDENNERIGEEVAQSLVKDSTILAVIGHNSSNVSLQAAPIYQSGRLVMISPTSNTTQLSGIGSYIFRTIPSVTVDADVLSEYAVKEKEKKNIGICIDSKAKASESIKAAFSDAVVKKGAKISPIICDINDKYFNAEKVVDDMVSKNVDALFLSPGIETIEKGITTATIAKPRVLLLSDSTLYINKTLERGKDKIEGMVLSVSWDHDSFQNNKFASEAKKIWGGPVSWRSANSYDATMAIIGGLRKSTTISREALQQNLSSSNFQVDGARGAISFYQSGDTKNRSYLVTVQKVNGADSKYKFVRLRK